MKTSGPFEWRVRLRHGLLSRLSGKFDVITPGDKHPPRRVRRRANFALEAC